jgi:signal transduction histidine kinase
MLAAGFAALHGLQSMYQEQQAVRHAFAERAEGISHLCLSIQVYSQTAQSALQSRNPRGDLERLAAAIDRDIDRLSSGNPTDETALLASLRALMERQRELFETRNSLLTAEQFQPLETLLLEWSRNAAAWNTARVAQDDAALLLKFGYTERTLSTTFVIALVSALLLVIACMLYILRLERQTHLRYAELARSRLELQQLSSRLVDAQESERRAISRELHDEIGQSLGALLVDLSRLSATIPPEQSEAKELAVRMKRVAEASVQAVRNIALLLRPSMLDDLGLGPALEWQGREVSRRSSIEVEVHADSVSSTLPPDYATCIYRLAQEALNNAVRHSNAKHAEVDVEQSSAAIRITIHDDGSGFDPKRTRGLGILGMEERVKRLGGSFTVASASGAGTTITAELPLPPAGAAA